MKVDDGTLNRYLINNLQSLTEADPSLLANYVAALLKNNKPKKELQELCIDQLYDFLGDGTKSFVAKLFQSLEDGTVPQSAEEMETSKAIESGAAISSGIDVLELRTSPSQLERLPSTAIRSFSAEDESSDDEDDDRNHKHKRRVSRSRSFDGDGEDEVGRGIYIKRGRVNDNGSFLRENYHQGNEYRRSGHTLQTERDSLGKFDRRLNCEHGSGQFPAEGVHRVGIRSGPQFRGEGPVPRFDGPTGMICGNAGRGRGFGGVWTPHDQRFLPPQFPDGLEFAPPLLPPGLGTGFFPARGVPGRNVPHNPWPGFSPLPGLGNGRVEYSHPLSGGMPGGRGPPSISASIGTSMNISVGHPRCLDFEERGYCLRGDLCPMEHGANRIVVEDVQSLSKFNLAVSLPSGRGLGTGPASGPFSSPILPPGLGTVNRNNHGNREASLPALGEDPAFVNGVTRGSAGVEPDSYDPDQPLWNKDSTETSSGLRTLSSFQKGSHDEEWEGDSVDKRENREGSEGMETGSLVRLGGNTTGGSQTSEGGASVWDRIGPVVIVASRLDAGLQTGTPVDVLHRGQELRKDRGDEAVPHLRGTRQGKWNREVDTESESAPKGSLSIPLSYSRGWGSGRGDAGAGQRSTEGTSYASRGTGGRCSSTFGTERAQRTLYVSFIPPNSNRTEQLLAHFQKFGDVLDVRIPAHSDRAFVQFSQREDAESALTAPDAVMGNRFIRLSWANRDSISDPLDGAISSGSLPVKSSSAISTGSLVRILKVPEKATMNGSSSTQLDLAPNEATGKSLSSNVSTRVPTGGVVKKKEELERMREEIRKKQEALAQKRDDFRRKLDQLAKQGHVQGQTLESEQPSKRQRLDDAEETASAPRKVLVYEPNPRSSAAAADTTPIEPSATLFKKNSGDVLKKQTIVSVITQTLQPSPRDGRLSQPRINNENIAFAPLVAWGPARFKIDNRTTVFRVLPPFPAAVVDVGVLKDHFVMFGELATVEVDDGEGPKMVVSTKLRETSSVQVGFATRRAAERAFVQGRWLHGQSLQLVWVNSPSVTTGSRGTAATSRADLLRVKPSIVTPKHLMELPTNVEQGLNGSRSLDQEITGHGQVTVTDGNILDEDV